jgi:hypothetical protein
MKRQPNVIISEIRGLIDELSVAFGEEKSSKGIIKQQVPTVMPKGALGAIQMLIDEGFLSEPKEISVILNRLKEIGHYHKSTAIAMNLLNLTKRRVLNRFKNKDTKNWEYVIRK